MTCKDCYFYDVCHSRIINGYGLPVGNAGGWTCLYTVETKDGEICSETDL